MNKNDLNLVEQIEYYLGKDRLPNLHWAPKIPNAWEITPRPGMGLCNPQSHNVTLTLSDIDYQLNNLGYRSNFDFNIDELKSKDIILILGDSDASGRGVTFGDMYSTKMQNNTDLCVLNLGIPGLSSDGMARVGVQTILALGSSIKHVCVLWPVLSLREFVSKTFKSGTHTHSDNIPYKDWWDHIDWVSNNYNYQKNHLLLEQTTLNAGAMYHELIINRYDTTTPITYTQVDDTFTEFTPDSHTAIAQYFLRKVQQQPSIFESTQS
jgi:hypothetical protein